MVIFEFKILKNAPEKAHFCGINGTSDLTLQQKTLTLPVFFDTLC